MDDAIIIVVGVAAFFTIEAQTGDERCARRKSPGSLAEHGVVVVAGLAAPVGDGLGIADKAAAEQTNEALIGKVGTGHIVEIMDAVGGKPKFLAEGLDAKSATLQQAAVYLGWRGGRSRSRWIGIGEWREILQRIGVGGVVFGKIMKVVLIDSGDGQQRHIAEVIADVRGEAPILGICDRHLADSDRVVERPWIDPRDYDSRRQCRNSEQVRSGPEFGQRYTATLCPVLIEVHRERRGQLIPRPPLQFAARAAGSIVVDRISTREIVNVAAPVAEGAAETERKRVRDRTGNAQRSALF